MNQDYISLASVIPAAECANVSSKARRAFFFLGQGTNSDAVNYPHAAIVLAEGLRDHGWAISSDVRTWQTAPGSEWLFPGDGISAMSGADLVVVTDDWVGHNRHASLPDTSMIGKGAVVYLDKSDLSKNTRFIYSPLLKQVDAIVRLHATGYFRYPTNVQPGVFGISNRIREMCMRARSNSKAGVSWSFRQLQFPHSVRRWAEIEVKPILERSAELRLDVDPLGDVNQEPYDKLMQRQTGGRHVSTYYNRLGRSLICPCFGGWFVLPWRQEEASRLCLLGRSLLATLSYKTKAVAQWDSWRLWEAFASGAVVLHLNFDEYRFRLPGPMPEVMKHYIAVDVDKPEKSLSAVLEDPAVLSRIGEAGRQWALEHYTSMAIAKRLLKSLRIT